MAPPRSSTISLLFLAACGTLMILPLVGFLLGVQVSTPLDENRNLAQTPDWEKDSWLDLPGKAEAYYKDHFGFRNVLIQAAATVRHRVLGLSSPAVILGKDDWIFYGGGNTREDFMGLMVCDREEMALWRAVHEGKRDWLRARGARYLLIVPPNKATIYPEHLPDEIGQNQGQGRLAQLAQALGGDDSFMDLRGPLMAAKRKGLLYYPTGTHWTATAKLHAMGELVKRLKGWGQPPSVWGEGDFLRGERPVEQDLVRSLGLADWPLAGPFPVLTPKARKARARRVSYTLPWGFPIPQRWKDRKIGPVATIKAGAPGRLVVFHDSFFSNTIDVGPLQPLRESFGKVVMLEMPLRYQALEAIVRWERPTMVIEEAVERTLRVPSREQDPDLERFLGE